MGRGCSSNHGRSRSGTSTSSTGIVQAAEKPLDLSKDLRFSLAHREELLEGILPAEHEEMIGAVRRALTATSGVAEGWVIEVVGGSRRQARPAGGAGAATQGSSSKSSASSVGKALHHDADLLCTHPLVAIDASLGQRMKDYLVDTGHMLPPEQAMLQLLVKENAARAPCAAPAACGCLMCS